MSKIIVTGGLGFIGQHIVNKLKDNNEILIIDNFTNNAPLREFCETDVELDILDILYYDKIIEVFKGFNPDYVIHLAAQSKLRDSIENPFIDAQNNIIGSLNILNACINSNVKKIIYASTGGARYGKIYGLCNETMIPEPVSPYGISKHTVEHYLEAYNSIYGLDYVTLCFGNVFGEGDVYQNSDRIIPKIISYCIDNKELEIYGDGTQVRDFIYVKEISDLIPTFFEKTNYVMYNIGSEKERSINSIIKKVEEFTLRPIKVKYSNKKPGEVYSNILDCTRLHYEFAWVPKYDFNDSLLKTIEWHKKEFYNGI